MKSEVISNFLQSRIDAKDFPSAVYLVAQKGEVVFQDALGFAVVEPERIEATLDTIYDLASLTKPLVTCLLCAKLIESGEINLNDKIAKYFPEFDTSEKREITIENLLTHNSGFKAWLPLYLLWENFPLDSMITDVFSIEKLEYPQDTKVVYSDLNFIILGGLLERIYGRTLSAIARKKITEPLGLKKTLFNPSTNFRHIKNFNNKVAASEKGNEYEKQVCIDLGFGNPPITGSGYEMLRDYQIWGEVHDGNAYFMNGVSGHAGLFSNAFETFKIAQQFLANETVLLKPETCKLFRTNFTENLNEARSIAFQLAATPDSTASKALSADSFGHLGFTGTSLWVEPETERIFILLTNRTHNRALPFENINSVRRKFHEMAVEALDEK